MIQRQFDAAMGFNGLAGSMFFTPAIRHSGGEEPVWAMRRVVLLRLGDRVIAQAPGYGDTLERPSEFVCADLVNGYIGAKFAKRYCCNKQ